MTLESYGRYGTDAYDLVDRLPNGPARAAAWNAYVCQTYADRLAKAQGSPSVVVALYDLARSWLERAHAPGPQLDLVLPPWGSAIRSQAELGAMRDTLGTLRTYVAFQIGDDDTRLGPVDEQIAAADALWIPRATPELRAGICAALMHGISAAAALGAACVRDPH